MSLLVDAGVLFEEESDEDEVAEESDEEESDESEEEEEESDDGLVPAESPLFESPSFFVDE